MKINRKKILLYLYDRSGKFCLRASWVDKLLIEDCESLLGGTEGLRSLPFTKYIVERRFYSPTPRKAFTILTSEVPEAFSVHFFHLFSLEQYFHRLSACKAFICGWLNGIFIGNKYIYSHLMQCKNYGTINTLLIRPVLRFILSSSFLSFTQ